MYKTLVIQICTNGIEANACQSRIGPGQSCGGLSVTGFAGVSMALQPKSGQVMTIVIRLAAVMHACLPVRGPRLQKNLSTGS